MENERNKAKSRQQGWERNSSLELFRIITMLVIIAHHYVVNSGLTEVLQQNTSVSFNSVFLCLFGWGGKTGINCFVLITGYFMCKSNITLKKFLKLILWMEFYKIIFYLIFLVTGYQQFAIKDAIKAVLPVVSVADGFGSAYLMFYLFIPFLNVLIKGMNKRQHMILMALCVFTYTVLSSVGIKVVFNYVTWFCVIYLIGSYIRLYPKKWFSNTKLWGCAAVVSLILSWTSVILIYYVTLRYLGEVKGMYFFVADSNKILALVTAVCAFMYFKNLNMRYSKFINTVAASAYGVLLIHANSDTMRQWLWKDTLNNVDMYNSDLLVIHAVLSVLGIYIVCTIIDMIRLRFFEKPLFKWFEKKHILK